MFRIKTISVNKIFLFFSILLGCFPIVSFGMRSIFTIVWSLFGIYIFYLKRKGNKLDSDIIFFIFPYLLLTFSIFYSTNIEYGLEKLIKMLSFLIFPIIFYLNRDFFSKKHIYLILDFFSLSVLILVLYQIAIIFFNFDIITSALTLKEIEANGFNLLSELSNEKIEQIKLRRFRNFIIKTSSTHTTYQGLWVGLTIFYLGLKSYNFKSNWLKIISIILILLLVLWLLLISARMPFLALCVSLISTILIFFKFSLKKKIFILSIPLFFLCSLIFFNNSFSVRVKEYYDTGLTILEKSSKLTEFNSSNVRNGIYFCDIILIKDHLIWGVGIGDIQDELNKCYTNTIGSKVYTWHTYNSHNQYAFFWISSGFLGLLSFLVLIFITFLKALKNKNFLLFFLTIITFLVFFTENLLERSDGLFFYCFLIGLLFFNKLENKL
jgi:O-antigen ligase